VTDRKEVLDSALKLVAEDRNNTYGEPEKNLERIAQLWTAYLDHPISAKDVALLMILLKAARLSHMDKSDSWIDIAGYAAIGAEVAL